MRTTVDLPESVHRRAQALARERGTSLSKTLAELTERGLHSLEGPVTVGVDERTGWPVLRFGRGPITPDDVADLLDEE